MSLHVAFQDLVTKLRDVKSVSSVRVLDEGAMIVDIAQPSYHEDIVIYLLAGELSVGFVKKTLNTNTQRDMHTLFILSPDLITEDGSTARMTDALRLLIHAYGGKVYAYRIEDQGVSIVPVFINRMGRVSYGEAVNLAELSGDYATFDNKYLLGVRKVAGFSVPQPAGGQETRRESAAPSSFHPLQPYYDVLGVPVTATPSEVKRAYRRKAMHYHPDSNPSPDATTRMQQINDAYQRIMERLKAH